MITASVGILAGLSVDHLVQVGVGARFYEPGGPGTFATLGAAAVSRTPVHLHVAQRPSAGHLALLAERAVIDVAADATDADELWILNSPSGRLIVSADRSGASNDLDTTGPTTPDDREFSPPPTWFDRLDGVLASNPPLGWQPPRRLQVLGIDPDQASITEHGLAYFESFAEHAAVLLPSRVQLQQLFDGDPVDAALSLHRETGCAVVASIDADGAVIVDRHTCQVLPSIAADVVDTTGAGDSMAGALVAALASGADLATATSIAMSVAAVTLSDWGARALANHQV